jgi:hypothetical protein
MSTLQISRQIQRLAFTIQPSILARADEVIE